jgi:D-beta-D-heptose 7-phosphate kinase / D-beta-D-heptose 1-phosphate adenosyltransferase
LLAFTGTSTRLHRLLVECGMTETLTDADFGAMLEILRQCRQVSILVMGDLMLDEYVTGAVERISPEAPVPVVHAGKTEFRLGGAANVARQIAALGASVTLIGVVGEDEAGERLRDLCQKSDISTEWILTSPGRKTTRKLRILSQSQQLLRIDWEDRDGLSPTDSQALINKLMRCPAPDATILSDYAKGVVTAPTIAGLICEGQHRGPIILDPKHRDFARYRGAHILTPNLRELSESAGYSLNASDLPAVTDAARAQIRTGNFEHLIVTLGDHGVLVVPAKGPELLIPALKRAVYDVTGAGDTVAAVFTTCLATGAAVGDSAYIANTAAGIAVGEIGAVAVPPEQIADALTGKSQSKVFSLASLQRQLSQWRAARKRIVFTNGCFDLLHPGHLSLLNYAKSLGDVLVLAINSDATIRHLKGDSRPVVSQSDRAAMLSALSCVDAVTVFDEVTPLEIISHVRPDTLVKGQDYCLDEVIGRDVVEAAGGRVVLAPLLSNYSTTSLLARARA